MDLNATAARDSIRISMIPATRRSSRCSPRLRAADHVDLAITWRADAYEVWSRRGMIRFKRFADERGALSFEVVEQIGENPIANQDPFIVSTIDEELDAAARSGNRTDDPNRA